MLSVDAHRRLFPRRAWRMLALLAALSCDRHPPSAPPPPEPVAKRTVKDPPATPLPLPSVPTPRDDIVETHFGIQVSDPYRWLENGDSEQVERWVAAQNERTRIALERTGLVGPLRQRLLELLEIGSVSRPAVRRGPDSKLRLFYERREGTQNQPVLVWRNGVHAEDQTLVDVNELDADGSVALDYFYPSPDGALVAYGLSENGSEQSTLYVREVASGRDLPTKLTRTRYASVCWHPDGKGFFYTRYPAPGSVPEGEEQYHRRVYEHNFGHSEPDREVFGSGRDVTDYPSCSISPDGRWLLLSVHVGWNRTDLFLADTRRRPLVFKELTQQKEHNYGTLVRNRALWVMTNEGAPRYALYRVDPGRPAREHWDLVLPEHSTDVLDTFNVLSDSVVAAYSKSAVSRLEHFDTNGRSRGDIPLPGIGSVDGISGVHDDTNAFFDFESFAAPTSVRRVDLLAGTEEVLLSVATPLAPEAFVVSRHSATSKDGTSIPYTIVHKRGTAIGNGQSPTLLYGYGGFNISVRPRFSRTNYAFLERGGVFVQANLRGGGEFGERWHRAGQLQHKQNVFDDFFAVAEALIRDRVTNPNRLAIYGRSNGGLLVAAALTQRPDLFKAAVSSVPLTDMLRYPLFLIARLWVPEYGSPADAEAFRWLYAYSPYHHVQPGTEYPATLFMTAESDTRVDPAHARKMTALLQSVSPPEHPILLRTEVKAGHGAGKPMRKVADEYADLYAFLMAELGMTAEAAKPTDD